MVVILASLFLLASNTPVHALVIAAPLIAISAFKASVFLVSLLSLPLTTLIHVIKKWGVLKTITVSLAVLGLVFGVAFGTLSLFKESSSKKMVIKDSGTQSQEYYDRIALPEQPSGFAAPSPYPPGMKRSVNWSAILLIYSIFAVALAVILLVPILIILIVVGKARNEAVDLKKILAISVLVSMVIAIPLAFGLGLLYTLITNNIVIY